jgi:DNA-binding NarL/FixJ family response regulator
VNSVTITAADGSPLLTSREQDVVRLVADGMKNREIAQALSLTEHSVRNYLYRIFEKLGVSSRAELMLYALSRRGVEVNPATLRGESEAVAPRIERAY